MLPRETSLQELKLVPAAVLYLSWKTTPELSTLSLPGGSYLNTSLYRTVNLLEVPSEESGAAEVPSPIEDPLSCINPFPRGQKLLKGERDREEASLDMDVESMSKKDSKPSAAAGTKKPRWLKT